MKNKKKKLYDKIDYYVFNFQKINF